MKNLWKLAPVCALLLFGACASAGTEEVTEIEVQRDCSAVRCASCPPGQTPALRPPDCCRCVPTPRDAG